MLPARSHWNGGRFIASAAVKSWNVPGANQSYASGVGAGCASVGSTWTSSACGEARRRPPARVIDSPSGRSVCVHDRPASGEHTARSFAAATLRGRIATCGSTASADRMCEAAPSVGCRTSTAWSSGGFGGGPDGPKWNVSLHVKSSIRRLIETSAWTAHGPGPSIQPETVVPPEKIATSTSQPAE